MARTQRLIYAEDAKKLFDDIPPFIGMTGKCVQEMLDKVPTVDAVEVVHGRWIKDGEVVVCSNCGEEHAWDEYRATYCEDCGAKMDGGVEDV